MRLRDLDAHFLVRREAPNHVEHGEVEALAEAQGVQFLCPLCFANNGGPIGTHMVICWFADRGVPDHATPGPGRWTPSGSGLDDLTFVSTEAHPLVSVQLNGGCGWHGHVRSGDAW